MARRSETKATASDTSSPDNSAWLLRIIHLVKQTARVSHGLFSYLLPRPGASMPRAISVGTTTMAPASRTASYRRNKAKTVPVPGPAKPGAFDVNAPGTHRPTLPDSRPKTNSHNQPAQFARCGFWNVGKHWDRRNHSAPFQFFQFNPDGTFAGSVRIARTIQLAQDANSYASTVSVEILNPSGNVVATLCGTESATRLFD